MEEEIDSNERREDIIRLQQKEISRFNSSQQVFSIIGFILNFKSPPQQNYKKNYLFEIKKITDFS